MQRPHHDGHGARELLAEPRPRLVEEIPQRERIVPWRYILAVVEDARVGEVLLDREHLVEWRRGVMRPLLGEVRYMVHVCRAGGQRLVAIEPQGWVQVLERGLR